MSDFLWQTYHRLVAVSSVTHQRFLYDAISTQHRLLGIVGPRGVGKTTMLLQYIKNELYADGGVFYFSADNIYFNENTLLAFVDKLYLEENIRYFFIDEIHKYPNWNQELKNIYDSFPDAKVIFSGSSSIDLIEGSYDLSRRAKLMHLPGMSFREYLNIKTNSHYQAISLDTLLKDHQRLAAELSQISTLMRYFNEYIEFGYYPIVLQNRDDVYPAIGRVIEKTIYEDIANYYQLKTGNLHHLRRILSFLASIPPGKVNTNNIASHIGIDNKTVNHYLHILEKSGMVQSLMTAAKGKQLLAKPAKIFLDNTTLLAALNTMLASPIDKGTQREIAFMQFITGAGYSAYFPDVGDFQIDGITFEVGGKNKSWQQLSALTNNKYLVKDQILVGSANVIPLYLFGFLY